MFLNAIVPLCRRSTVYSLLVAMSISVVACQNDIPQRGTHHPKQTMSGPGLRIKMNAKMPLQYGDTLRMRVESKDKNAVVELLTVDVVDGPKKVYNGPIGNVSLPTAIIGGGKIRLRLSAKYTDGKSTARYKEVGVVAPPPEAMQLAVVRKYPHDVSDYTQGLVMHGGYVYEGTGQYGQSKIKEWNLQTGEVLQQTDLSGDYFGEGIALFNDKIYQLTYKASQAFVYRVEDFEHVETHTYATRTGEGWGLASNDTSLILSDGSSTIYFYDPVSFGELKRLNVFDDRGDVELINELEYDFHSGLLYANLYTRPDIVAIDPKTGMVMRRLSAKGVVDRADASPNMDVLNGIALAPTPGNLLITGKYWSKVYEVRPVPVANP